MTKLTPPTQQKTFKTKNNQKQQNNNRKSINSGNDNKSISRNNNNNKNDNNRNECIIHELVSFFLDTFLSEPCGHAALQIY